MQGMVIVAEWTERCGSSLIQTDEELLEQEREREIGKQPKLLYWRERKCT
jgi:hypothetical protein